MNKSERLYYFKLLVPFHIKSSVLLFYFLLFQLNIQGALSQAPLLPNACKHNEFRCADGSACLKAEKLCNGVDDCPGGEDESGNDQWDCSRTTLSTECGTMEFRCRVGGCIPIGKLCDGNADCWGGSDESTDLCQRGGGHRRPPQHSRPPGKPQVSSPQPTIETVTSPSPRPTPVFATTQSVTIPSTEPPSVGASSSSCRPPPIYEGSRVQCQSGNFRVNCGKGLSPEGTKATYMCRQFWEAPTTGSKTATITCRNGAWEQINRKWGCTLQCGQDGGKDIGGFIVGGKTSDIGKWPWHVGFYHQDPPGSGKYEYFCGGSLISRRAVLTAAHCVTTSRTSEKRTDIIMAGIGKYNRTYNSNDHFVQIKRVSEIDIETEYSVQFYENDIAIAWLDKNVDITERVRPVCLPSYDDGIEPGLQGTLAGWGRWADRGYPEHMQEAQLPVVGIKTCRDSHKSLESLSRSTTFCAGHQNGTSACDGDSGGGLIFEDRRKWYIQGIVSAGVALRAGGCDPNHYTVFTRVDKYKTWIYSLLDRKDTLRR